MIKSTDSYKRAITADSRRVRIKAFLHLIDPDLSYGEGDSSGHEFYSDLDQLHDSVLELSPRNATLEKNRWVLDGGFHLIDDPLPSESAYVSSSLCGSDGVFSTPQWCQIGFSGVSVLQAFTVAFPDSPFDGIPVDFSVDVLQRSSSYYHEEVTGNTESKRSFSGFTVYNPDSIRVTVTKWSLPYRRARVAEILPGWYEEWSSNDISKFSIRQQCDISNLTLPYGTCTICIDNKDRRFEPRKKNALFLSIEDRQGIDVYIGVDLPDGSTDWKPCGVYYQHTGGWTTSDNSVTIEWSLVDIIGLLVDRRFNVPEVLPETLEGWISLIVSHLGESFNNRYHIDPEYANLPCIVRTVDVLNPDPDKEDLEKGTCGYVLRMVCMACGVFPRADSLTGELAIEPLWSEGNNIDLNNIERYPTMSANEDVASVVVNGVEFGGNNVASPKTVDVDNPFIRNTDSLLKAVRAILSTFGGNKLSTTGRGDPSSEIGDVEVVSLDKSSATTGRLIEQNFSFNSGVMKGCSSVLLQADGSFLWESTQKFVEDGVFVVPPGVSKLRMILVGHGEDGTDGIGGTADIEISFSDGTSEYHFHTSSIIIEDSKFNNISSISIMRSSPGSDGVNGHGGMVWSGTVPVNPGEQIPVHIGSSISDPTTAGVYSSSMGKLYDVCYADVQSGDGYARSGVELPKDGTGDGGQGGTGGSVTGSIITYPYYQDRSVISYDTGRTTKGSKGAKGCVVFYWEVD